MGSPKALLRYRGQTFLDTLISLFAARCSPVIVVLGADADRIRRGLSCRAAPDTAPRAAFDAAPGTAFSAAPNAALDAAPSAAPGTASSAAPHAALDAAPGTSPDAALDAAPGTSPGAAPSAAPDGARHVASHAAFVINPDYRTGQTSSMQCGLRAVPPDAEGVLFTLADHPAVAAATIEALTAQPRPLIRVPRFEGRRGHPVWFSRALIAEFLALPANGAARDVVYRHVDETEYLDVNDPGIVADIDDPAAYRELIGAGA